MSQDVQKYDPVFLQAVAGILNDEGGYVCDPDDPGGATKYGISKRSYPNEDIENLTAERATALYWERWMVGGFYRLKGTIAIKVFNLSVVMGPAPAVNCLQRALRAIGYGDRIVEDGELGIATANYSNSFTNVPALLAALRSEAAGYFRTIAHDNAQRTRFLAGWLKRAYS